jgi:broad specificity phosphatase PhoE
MTSSTWEGPDWLESARELMGWLQAQPARNSVMLLLRHSHREVLLDHEDMLGGGLTELGKATSIEVGRRIPTQRRVHFFFSIVPRCYETADSMAAGFTEAGGKVVDMDPLPTLVGPEYTEQSVWANLQPNGDNITEFVNRWADGEFGAKIEPLSHYQNRIMEDTVRKLSQASEPITHVHITHDLGLMCAKRFFLGRGLVHRDREPYLGGIGVRITHGEVMLFMDGQETELDPNMVC